MRLMRFLFGTCQSTELVWLFLIFWKGHTTGACHKFKELALMLACLCDVREL
jgi:hypothetical protein